MAKKEEKALVSQEMRDAVVKPEYTGGEGGGRRFPPVINILQSDKQYKAFGEQENEITKAMYGKLFIRKPGVKIEDMVDSIEGTIIRHQSGHEIRDEADQTIVGSYEEFMPADEKERYLAENPNHKVVNMVKVVLCPYSADEAQAMMESGEVPFAILAIKGSSFGAWMDAQRAMSDLTLNSEEYGYANSGDVLVSAFKFKLGSQEEKGGEFKYYSFTIEPSLQSIDEAYSYQAFVLDARSFSLFKGVAEAVAEEAKVEEKELPFVEKVTEEFEDIAEPPEHIDVLDK